MSRSEDSGVKMPEHWPFAFIFPAITWSIAKVIPWREGDCWSVKRLEHSQLFDFFAKNHHWISFRKANRRRYIFLRDTTGSGVRTLRFAHLKIHLPREEGFLHTPFPPALLLGLEIRLNTQRKKWTRQPQPRTCSSPYSSSSSQVRVYICLPVLWELVFVQTFPAVWVTQETRVGLCGRSMVSRVWCVTKKTP